MAKRPRSGGAGKAQREIPGLLTHIDLTPHKSIRLAVSGDVALSRLEVLVLDTPAMQRLRHIRQLGAAFWVYPTALHTRFDHSLGTLEMAQRMIAAIRGNLAAPEAEREIAPAEEQLARLFALLHDVTHIPFGHTLEDEFCIFPRHDNDDGRIGRFLGAGSAIGAILAKGLGGEGHERLINLFRAAAGAEIDLGSDHFILDLVAGTLCADLLDYLRRDAFFCNLALDADYRFLRHLAVVAHGGKRRLVIRLWKDGAATPRRDVLNELVRLLDNRYLLGERVYYHHAKLVAGAMIAGAVARARRAGELEREELLAIGDDVLLDRLLHSTEPAARRIGERLARRALWKPAYLRNWKAVAAEQQQNRAVDVFADLMARFHRNAPARTREEDRIAGLLGMEPGDVLIHCPDHRMAMKSADSLVFWNGAVRPLKDCGDDDLVGGRLRSILDSHQNLWAVRVFLNPDHREKADAVAEAADALFTYEPERRERFERQFQARVHPLRTNGN